jgi:hypothetical protein
MTITHCLPSGSLGTAELPVCQISAATTTAYGGPIGSGNVRGVVVFLNGLDVTTVTLTAMPPVIRADDNTAGFNWYGTTLKNSLVADGWIVLVVPYQENFYSLGTGAQGIYNDVNADTGHGSRYLASTLHWWDHVVAYVRKTYGATIPIVTWGMSWGGQKSLAIAQNKPSTLTAFAAHCPSTWLRNADFLYTGVQYGQIDTSGLDLSASSLAGAAMPGVIGYGTNDSAIGYGGVTTVAAGSAGVDSAAVTTLNVASTANTVQGVSVTVTGLTGGVGWATFTYTGTSGGNQFTGCTRVGGSGTLALNNPVTQSLTSAILAASPANVVAYSTTDTHELTAADAAYYSGTWFANTVDPLCPKVF